MFLDFSKGFEGMLDECLSVDEIASRLRFMLLFNKVCVLLFSLFKFVEFEELLLLNSFIDFFENSFGREEVVPFATLFVDE